MPATLQDSPRYLKFVADRDKALERIHQHAQIDLSRILYEALDSIERVAASLAVRAEAPFVQTHTLTLHFEQSLTQIFSAAFPEFLKRMIQMRKSVFLLTYASEQEAIGRATQRPAPRISKDELKVKMQKALSAPTLMGPLDKRTWHAILSLRSRIALAFSKAVFSEKKPFEIVDAVKASFPKIESYKRPPRALTKLHEADRDPADKEDWFQFGFITDDDWKEMLEDYSDTTLDENRFDNLTEYVGEDGVSKYSWELEQEATEDFVKQARDGQIEAANDLGVQDFVWVAIIDSSTCDECCLPRNGKTTREIEEMDDECDAVSPPAHWNCRCCIAPVASTNEVQGPDWSSFNDWLES